MSRGDERTSRIDLPPHLPPRDAWKVDPDNLEKFFAPIDDRGFVLPDATVERVLALFYDDYDWPINHSIQQMRPDLHHFHWYGRLYGSRYYQGRTIPHSFRELATLKGIVPRQFHNVIHKVTIVPNVPRYRDMERYVMAYELARRLLTSATNTTRAQELVSNSLIVADSGDMVANELLIERFDRQFRGYKTNLERLIGVAGLEQLRLDDEKFTKRRPQEIAKRLGVAASGNVINFVPLFKQNKVLAAVA